MISFLHNQTELNLTANADAGEYDNAITVVDLVQPNKTSALDYLDGNGTAPARYGKAVVMFGATDEVSFLLSPSYPFLELKIVNFLLSLSPTCKISSSDLFLSPTRPVSPTSSATADGPHATDFLSPLALPPLRAQLQPTPALTTSPPRARPKFETTTPTTPLERRSSSALSSPSRTSSSIS